MAKSSGISKVESLRCCVEHGNGGSSAQMDRLFSYIILERKWKNVACHVFSQIRSWTVVDDFFFFFSDPLSVVWLSFYWFLSVLL